MNDPNKRIDIDKSSLLSLKAELLRKQAEASQAKRMSDFIPKKHVKPPKPEKPSTKSVRKEIELEDSAQLARSKKILEAKAKYYEKMVKAGGNSDGNSLVMFNQKQQETRYDSSDSDTDERNIFDESQYPDEDWVEYMDCLGRTRKCLKKDLPSFQKRDESLSKIVEARNQEQSEILQQNEPKKDESTENSAEIEKILHIPQVDDIGERFIEQRKQWEKQEVENMQKEFVHYQDVLFDEAREHGVGYYAFANDEEERRKQQKELENIRKATLEAQKQKEELRNARDNIIAERVKAAKARQRARLGLPPEEDEPEPPQPSQEELLSSEEQKQKAAEQEQAEQRKIEEQLRAAERRNHVRPWDKLKEPDVDEEWRPRSERIPVSQEVWNDQQREQRNPEFAPPTNFHKNYKKNENKRKNKYDHSYQPEPTTSNETQEPFYEDRTGSLFFTTKKQEFKRKNYGESSSSAPSTSVPMKFDPVPIRNELSSDEEEDNRDMGTAIPPPPSWDYYTPESNKRQKKDTGQKLDWERSIEAGLKYLREQSDKSQVTTKNKWTANADY